MALIHIYFFFLLHSSDSQDLVFLTFSIVNIELPHTLPVTNISSLVSDWKLTQRASTHLYLANSMSNGDNYNGISPTESSNWISDRRTRLRHRRVNWKRLVRQIKFLSSSRITLELFLSLFVFNTTHRSVLFPIEESLPSIVLLFRTKSTLETHR